MNAIILNQTPFYTINSFSEQPLFRKGSGKSGVYLWGFSMEKDDYKIPSSPEMFFPYYVGKAKDVYSRTYEHLVSLVGGNYPLFDIINSHNQKLNIGDIINKYQIQSRLGKELGGPLLPNVNFSELLHFPEGIHLFKNFYSNDKLKNLIEWMLKHFCIVYFIPDSTESNETSLSNLEKRIGNLVNYNKLITRPYIIKEDKSDNQIFVKDVNGNNLLQEYPNIFIYSRGQRMAQEFGI